MHTSTVGKIATTVVDIANEVYSAINPAIRGPNTSLLQEKKKRYGY